MPALDLSGFATTFLATTAALFVFAVGVGVLLVIILYIIDITQTQHAIRRNFPVIGRLRYMLEHVGVFLRQYFYAMDREEMPFNRAIRAWGFSEQPAIFGWAVMKLMKNRRFLTEKHGGLGFFPSFLASQAHLAHQRQQAFARQPQVG